MSFTTIIVLVLSALAAAQLVFSFVQARRLRELASALAASSAVQQELLNASGQALLSLQGSVSGLEQKLARTVQRQQDLENKDAGSLTYEQASKLIQMGAAPEDLVKTCGLSQAEARLVSLMAARGIGRAS